MKDNSYDFGEYILENLAYAVIGFIWYKNILLRCLADMTYDQSRQALISMIAIVGTIGIIVNLGKNRNGRSTFANIALPFGIYTAIAYMSVYKLAFIIALVCPTVMACLFVILIMSRHIKSKKHLPRILLDRIRQAISWTQFFFAVGLSFVMVIIGIGALWGSSILQPTVAAITQKEIEQDTIANNIDSILLLQEDLWQELSVQEKLDVLQIVANIERRYLGIPHELNVGVANIGEHTLGYYNDKKHEIISSFDSLVNDSAAEVLDTICHEAYHGYEHCIASTLEDIPEESQNLRLFKDARNYADEFSDYKSNEQDFYDYYYQECEQDAREYAKNAVFDYYWRIDEYLYSED